MKTSQMVILAVVGTTVFLTYLNLYEMSNILLPGGFLHRASIKRVDKHFFFELLSQFDPVVRPSLGVASMAAISAAAAKASAASGAAAAPPLQPLDGGSAPATAVAATTTSHAAASAYKPQLLSEFSDLVDRSLLVQYLAERFAYTSFLQISCQSQRTYQLLPDAKITTKLCVDAQGGGTHTIDPIKFISDTVISRTTALYAASAAGKRAAATSSSSFFSFSSSSSSSSSSLSSSTAASSSAAGASSSSSALQKQQDDRSYDIILVESRHVMLSITLLDSLFELLADGGVLVLTDTTTFTSSWREVFLLRQRDGFDCATLDADHGLTVVTKRHNQFPLDLSRPPAASAAGAAAAGVGSVPTRNATSASASPPEAPAAENPKTLSFERFMAERQRVLNLVSFEDLHRWLAPTGNVDLVTAFGGRKGLDAFRETIELRERCSAALVQSRGSGAGMDKALACFHDALAAGRLSLLGRWQLALLLMSRDRLVDAVTMLGELQGISPHFYKWVLTQSSLALAVAPAIF